jgi:hypothetical protein
VLTGDAIDPVPARIAIDVATDPSSQRTEDPFWLKAMMLLNPRGTALFTAQIPAPLKYARF